MAARLQEAARPNSILVSTEVANYLPRGEIIGQEFHKLKGIGDEVLTLMVTPELPLK